MSLDKVKNFAKVTVDGGYTSSDTDINLVANDGDKLPFPPFNLVWYNATDYPDVESDPDKEIVRVTGVGSATVTVTRGQEGTTAVDHNTTGKTYKMIQSITEKMIDDINNHIINTANPHNVLKAQVGLGYVENLKVNLTATAPPTTDDDASAGYTVGSRWIDTSTGKEYVCTFSNTSMAMWIETTNIGFKSGFAAVSSTTQDIAASTYTKVAFDTKKFDGLGEYDTSLYRFTANVAGRYFFAVDLDFKFNSASDGHYCYLFLYRNGAAEQTTLNYFTDTNDHTANFNYNIELAAGDYIEIYVYTADVGTVETYSRFNGQRVY